MTVWGGILDKIYWLLAAGCIWQLRESHLIEVAGGPGSTVVHTCPDIKYWSEVLCCTIPTHMSELEVKGEDLEKKYVKVFSGKSNSSELLCP